jgi:hypothetical protein
MTGRGEMDMEEKNKPGETVPEPGESERISAERKAALQDIDRKREEKEKLRQTQKQEAVKVHGSLSAYMNWPLLVCIALLILSIIITMIDWMAGGKRLLNCSDHMSYGAFNLLSPQN